MRPLKTIIAIAIIPPLLTLTTIGIAYADPVEYPEVGDPSQETTHTWIQENTVALEENATNGAVSDPDSETTDIGSLEDALAPQFPQEQDEAELTIESDDTGRESAQSGEDKHYLQPDLLLPVTPNSLKVPPWEITTLASATLSFYVSITSVSYSASTQSITVNYRILKDIPSRAGIKLCWKYASATRNNTSYSSVSLDGKKKGSYTKVMTGVPKYRMIARAVVSMARPAEEISKSVLVDSGTYTNSVVVSKAQAAATVVVSYIPGFALTFSPQTKVVKILGGLYLTWSGFRDIMDVTTIGNSCPKLKAGQYIVTRTWLTMEGNTAKLKANIKVWHSKADYTGGKYRACDITSTIGSWT